MLKTERNKQNHAVESIAECEVRVGEHPDKQMLSRAKCVRLQTGDNANVVFPAKFQFGRSPILVCQE